MRNMDASHFTRMCMGMAQSVYKPLKLDQGLMVPLVMEVFLSHSALWNTNNVLVGLMCKLRDATIFGRTDLYVVSTCL